MLALSRFSVGFHGGDDPGRFSGSPCLEVGAGTFAEPQEEKVKLVCRQAGADAARLPIIINSRKKQRT
jgi:hypothetical protein